jgi:hypothetical protein
MSSGMLSRRCQINMSSGMLSRRCQLRMSSGTFYRVALVRTDVLENVSSPSSGFLKLIVCPQLYYCGNTEEGEDTFSETSVQTSVTRYKVPEDIFN